ncbi:MAG: Gfo/Idh/MocA family oxidoreductase [Candidatus Latescibacterota bacterium]
MSTRRVRVGIVGLGHNGLAHAQVHQRLPQSDLVALCDRRADRLEEAARCLGVRRLYADDAIFADPEIDAISIHTGDAQHRDPFERAVGAGKHVLVEKPLANREEDVFAMVAAAERARPDLKVQVGYILRFNPVFAAIQAQAPSLGRIFYLEGDYVHNLLYQQHQTDPVTRRNWYLEQELPMVGGGSHPLDLLRWIKGEEVVSVSSYANHMAFPEMRHDDCMVSLFRFADGAIAKVAALYGPRCGMAPFYNLRIYGTRGTVERDQIAVCATQDEAHPAFRPVDSACTEGHPYDPEVADWLDAILQDRPPRTPLKDGARSTLATLCAVRAAREGREVRVPELP